jgi:hypothetical protein
MFIGWFGIAVAIIISLLVVNKLKISNLWMIPITIAEIIIYGIIILVFKMIVPIVIIILILGIIYFIQQKQSK